MNQTEQIAVLLECKDDISHDIDKLALAYSCHDLREEKMLYEMALQKIEARIKRCNLRLEAISATASRQNKWKENNHVGTMEERKVFASYSERMLREKRRKNCHQYRYRISK